MSDCRNGGRLVYERPGVTIGEVATFPDPRADKEQAKKVLEEAAEVYGAWEDWHLRDPETFQFQEKRRALVDECADLFTATCNLLAALGVRDMRGPMRECEERNRKRGRI